MDISEMRNVCKEIIGKRLEDITTNDPGEDPFVELLFEGGAILKFPVTPRAILAEIDDSDEPPNLRGEIE